MKIVHFWNKAIESYCVDNNYKTVFISIPEESLETVKESYLMKGASHK